MQHRGVPFVAILVSALFCGMAQAEPVEVSLAGKILKFSPPAGTCVYDKTNPRDAQVLSMLEKSNQGYNTVVLAFSDCKDLEALRQGKSLPPTGDYGQILSPLAAGKFAQYSRSDVVSSMTEYFRKNAGIFDASSQKGKEIIDSLSNGQVKLTGSHMLGVLGALPDMVQVGLIETVQAGNRTMPLAGIITMTKIGATVSVNLYHAYTDEAWIKALAARAADYTRALIALNPDVESGTVPVTRSWNSHETLWVALIGALLGGAISFFRKVKRGRRE